MYVHISKWFTCIWKNVIFSHCLTSCCESFWGLKCLLNYFSALSFEYFLSINDAFVILEEVERKWSAVTVTSNNTNISNVKIMKFSFNYRIANEDSVLNILSTYLLFTSNRGTLMSDANVANVAHMNFMTSIIVCKWMIKHDNLVTVHIYLLFINYHIRQLWIANCEYVSQG